MSEAPRFEIAKWGYLSTNFKTFLHNIFSLPVFCWRSKDIYYNNTNYFLKRNFLFVEINVKSINFFLNFMMLEQFSLEIIPSNIHMLIILSVVVFPVIYMPVAYRIRLITIKYRSRVPQ